MTQAFSLENLPQSLESFLEAEQKRLIRDSLLLRHYFATCTEPPEEIHDFAFIVFPFAKAYEGFLKAYFYRKGLITEKVYRGRHFRVGRSFNPDLPAKFRDEFWIYDDVSHECGKDLARDMWNIWLDARNHIFHYFPDEKYDMTLQDAHDVIDRGLSVMVRAINCGVLE